MGIAAHMPAGAAVVHIVAGVDFTAVRVCRIAIREASVTARDQAASRCAALACIRKAAPKAASAAVGQGVRRQLAPVVGVAVAVSPQAYARRTAAAGYALGSPMRIGTGVSASAAISDIDVGVRLTPGSGCAIGISRLAVRDLATAGNAGLVTAGQIADNSTAAAIRERVQGQFTTVVGIAVAISP